MSVIAKITKCYTVDSKALCFIPIASALNVYGIYMGNENQQDRNKVKI